ncbi:MAG: AMP-binding protein [Dehalococcoidia bacterium]
MDTLVDLLRESCARYADLPALSYSAGKSERWSWRYATLWDYALRVAGHLRGAGVAPGDRVIIWGANRPEWVAAFFGALATGATVVPMDVRSRPDFLDRLIEQTSPTHIFVGKEQASHLKAGHHPTATLLDTLRPTVADAPPAAPAAVDASDIAELVFTSGTTGNPKGVILTHANIMANVVQSRFAIHPTPKNRVASLLPLSHMFEQMGGLFVPMYGGASVVYIGSLRPDVIFDAMSHYRVTNMSCVPQVLQLFRDGIEREVRKQGKEQLFARLLRVAPRLPIWVRRRLFSQVHARMGGSFEFFVSGGAYLDPSLARWWESLGVKVVQGYGTTEASPVISADTLDDRLPEAVGRPLPGVVVKIGEDGEILVRGANVTQGYWQNPTATAEAFTAGWYRTGDFGSLGLDGRLRLIGRKKNLIVLSNGMNVHPEDIEHVLTTQPGVKDAVVLGLHEGQDVKVHAVLLLEDRDQPPTAIVRAANARLAAHQHIDGATVWPEESFPLTPTLKPKRADITARVEDLRRGPSMKAGSG